MSYANAAAAYRQNSILTASPEKIIKMLYDGAIQNLERSRIALAEENTKRSPEAGISLGKALSIVGELRSALNHEVGGDISRNLDALYEFSIDRISQANLNRETQPVEDTLVVLRTLKEGWDAIIPG